MAVIYRCEIKQHGHFNFPYCPIICKLLIGEMVEMFNLNVLVDENDQACGCWVTKSDAPNVIIEASWYDRDNLPQKKYPDHTVQQYSHSSLSNVLEAFWKISLESEWQILNFSQLVNLEKLWFGDENDL